MGQTRRRSVALHNEDALSQTSFHRIGYLGMDYDTTKDATDSMQFGRAVERFGLELNSLYVDGNE